VKRALVTALFLLLSTCAGPQVSASDLPDVRVMMGRVEQILRTNGYPDVWGYASRVAPDVVTVDALPDWHWGEYVPGLIKISAEQPDGCRPVTLAHELAHDAAVRMNLISVERGAPAWLVKAELEKISRLVESHVASDGVWLPNCLLHRGVE
jgi:hypothetical protein